MFCHLFHFQNHLKNKEKKYPAVTLGKFFSEYWSTCRKKDYVM